MYKTEELHGQAHVIWLSFQELENCLAVISFNPYTKPRGNTGYPFIEKKNSKDCNS